MKIQQANDQNLLLHGRTWHARQLERTALSRKPFAVIAVFALLALAFITVWPAQATPTSLNGAYAPQAFTLTFAPAADASVSQSAPGTNFGASTGLQVSGKSGSIQNSYIRFAVSGITGTIQSATLRVYSTFHKVQDGPAVYLAGNDWIESGSGGITWKTRPGILGSAVDNKSVILKDAWVQHNVTPRVSGNGLFTFALVEDGSGGISFSSREGGQAPQLIVSVLPPTSTPTARATATALPPYSGSVRHVFVIVMENHSYSEVWNTASSPYITQLGTSFSRATNYHAATHPSLPNYLDLYAGASYGITTDCSPSATCQINASSLADKLEAAGLTWRAYMQSMPAPCYPGGSGYYVPKHNPFIYFDNIRNNSARCNAHVVPFYFLAANLALASTTPNYVFISPNMCDDMHSCPIQTGDTWLKNHVPSILSSPACTSDTCLLIITWDEDHGNYGNHVLTIFAGSGAKRGGVMSTVPYTHFSMLHTIEYIFGLSPQTANDAAAAPMIDLLR